MTTWKLLGTYYGSIPKSAISGKTVHDLYLVISIGNEEWYNHSLMLMASPSSLSKNKIQTLERTADIKFNMWDANTILTVSNESGGTVGGSKIVAYYR